MKKSLYLRTNKGDLSIRAYIEYLQSSVIRPSCGPEQNRKTKDIKKKDGRLCVDDVLWSRVSTCLEELELGNTPRSKD